MIGSRSIFDQAEEDLANYHYVSAYANYQAVIADRISKIRTSSDFCLSDVIAIERLAELSVLFGKSGLASSLLATIEAVFTEAGNIYAADVGENNLRKYVKAQ